MSLLDMQRAFARLLTDRTFREKFHSDGLATLESYGLTEEETSGLANLPVGRLNRFTTMLQYNRVGLALRTCPVTASLLPTEFIHQTLNEYCQRFPPRPVPASPLANEARLFAQYLRELIEEGSVAIPYLREALDYEDALFQMGNSASAEYSAKEALKLSASFSDACRSRIHEVSFQVPEHVKAIHFRYNMDILMPHLQQRHIPDLDPESSWLLFVKAAQSRGVRLIKVSKNVFEVLTLCRDRKTYREILAFCLGARQSTTEQEAGYHSLLCSLADKTFLVSGR